MQEQEWIEKSKKGDEVAFEKLYLAHKQEVYHLCMQKVHDAQLAEDLTQEAFLKAYGALSSFEGRAKFSSWLYKIAYHLCCSYLRAQKERPLEYEEGKKANEEKKEIPSEDLEKAMALLSPKQRAVFELFDVKNYSTREIAQKLSIPEGTVRSRLHYARKKMQQFLND